MTSRLLHDKPSGAREGVGVRRNRGDSRRRCPRQDSNLRFRLRRSALYPLSYEGGLPSLLLAITGLCLSMAIGAEQAEIREFVIQSVSVDVIEFQRERAAVP
jgi:hypothetical protein